jgi:hypothetical protein
MFVIVACSSISPDYIPPDWKMGQRRGRGVEPAHLHDSFTLAHSVLSAPGAPEHANIDPSVKLAEDLWFAGDRDFAAALSKESMEVRRSVAHYLSTDSMMRNFPRTHASFQPLSESKSSNQAMPRTASKAATDAPCVCHTPFDCVESCPACIVMRSISGRSGLAVADLVSLGLQNAIYPEDPH